MDEQNTEPQKQEDNSVDPRQTVLIEQEKVVPPANGAEVNVRRNLRIASVIVAVLVLGIGAYSWQKNSGDNAGKGDKTNQAGFLNSLIQETSSIVSKLKGATTPSDDSTSGEENEFALLKVQPSFLSYPVELKDGAADLPGANASNPDANFLRLLPQFAALGDFDGNGTIDLAIVVEGKENGPVHWYDLAVFTEWNGEWQNIGTALLGDRVKVQSVREEDKQIVVELLSHGPDDFLENPTRPHTIRFELTEKGLIEK